MVKIMVNVIDFLFVNLQWDVFVVHSRRGSFDQAVWCYFDTTTGSKTFDDS